MRRGAGGGTPGNRLSGRPANGWGWPGIGCQGAGTQSGTIAVGIRDGGGAVEKATGARGAASVSKARFRVLPVPLLLLLPPSLFLSSEEATAAAAAGFCGLLIVVATVAAMCCFRIPSALFLLPAETYGKWSCTLPTAGFKAEGYEWI